MSTEIKLVISASQIDDFIDCPRRWWFKRIMKLREIQKGYFTFGTVLHGCIERWMAGTMNGRVPDPVPEVLAGQTAGASVEVFPPGWETIEEKGQKVSVTPNEASLIKRLFKEAVERGIITRDPHATVEREIRLPVLENVELLGFVDIHVASVHGSEIHEDDAGLGFSVPEIHDHKSFGESSTRYLKQPGPTDEGGNLIPIEAPYEKGDGTSPNAVGHNQQMLTYATATSMIDGYEGVVKVRHNQYPKFKDAKGVRKVEALISPKRLKAHWAFIENTARRMVQVAQIKKWTDTPGPESVDACSRFGGCPFQGICGKRESPEVYSARVERMTAQKASQTRPNLTLEPRKRKPTKTDTGGTTTMTTDIFARARNQQAARKGEPAPATTAKPTVATKTAAAKAAANPKPAPAATKPAAAPKVNSAPPPAVETATDGAPWANPTCPACKGLGINSKGRACPICDKTAEKRGVPTSAMYVIEVADGAVTAVLRDEHADTGAPEAWAGDVPVQGAAATAKPAVAPKAQARVEEPPDEQPEPEVEADTDEGDEGAEASQDEPEAPPAAPPARNTRAAAAAALTRQGSAPTPTPGAVARTAPKPAASEPARSVGRPKVGLTVLIGAAMMKGPERPTLLATELLERIGAELAADMGAESYWALDAFKRRERIRQRGAEIAESLGKTVVMVGSTNDPDVMSLVNALMAAPSCEAVYEGLR